MIRSILLAAALASAAPAQTQPQAQSQAAEPAGPDVVVTANRNRDQEIHDFVAALTRTDVNSRQISRFEDAICPAALGLAPAQRDKVVARIRLVARTAGLHLDGAHCTANLILFIVEDKRAFITAIEKRYPEYFTDIPHRELRELSEGPGPAAAWQAREMRNADGRAMARVEGVYINQTTRGATRLAEGARPSILASALVVERRALTGLTTTQLADYAVMRTLTHADPDKLPASTAGTILKILDAPMGAETPITLTAWDLGFLKSLYDAPKNLTAPADRARIGRELGKALDRPGGGN